MSKSSKSASKSSTSSSSSHEAPLKSALKEKHKAAPKGKAKAAPKKVQFEDNAREEASEDETPTTKKPNVAPANSGKRWNDDDEETLSVAAQNGTSLKEIADVLGRTLRSIEYRVFYLIETKLRAKGYFDNLVEHEDDVEYLCNDFHTTVEAFKKYLDFNKMRKERRAAQVLAKHDVANALRQLHDGLYIKVAHVPSSKELKEQVHVKDLNAKIDQLQEHVAKLSQQLHDMRYGKRNYMDLINAQ
jgi:hypothetical protein